MHGREIDLVLEEADPEQVRRWIVNVCDTVGITTTGFARTAGVAPSTLNRFVNKQNGSPRNLSGDTIYKLQVTAKKLLSGAKEDILAKSTRYRSNTLRERNTRRIEVVGHVAAGEWRNAMEWPDDERYVTSQATPQIYDGYTMIGLEIHGDSMDLKFPHGSVVTCVPFSEMSRRPKHGDFVVVLRPDAEGQVEATVKEYQLDNDGCAWLLARSTDPKYQQPIRLGHPDDEMLDDRPEIRYLIIGSYTPLKVDLPPR